MKSPDPYTVAFNALKKRGEQARPFQVLTRTEVGLELVITQYWEDLVTGEKKVDRTTRSLGSVHETSCTPFLKTIRGPYFLNPIESVIKKFRRKENDTD